MNQAFVSDQDTREERSALRYLREIAVYSPLSAEQEAALVRGLPTTATALIEGHLHTVVQIAQFYTDLGVPLLDLIGEGNLCLVQTVHAAVHGLSTQPFAHTLAIEVHRVMAHAISAAPCADPQVFLLPLSAGEHWSAHRAAATPEEVLLREDACAGVLAVLSQLSPAQRDALATYYGFVGTSAGSFVAVGRELGVSAAAARSHVGTGVQTLQLARRELSALVTAVSF